MGFGIYAQALSSKATGNGSRASVGKVKSQWGRLAGDCGKVTAGNGDVVAEKSQETHGGAQDGAEARIKRFGELKRN
jgi:uncharacterized protein YjbJ (UPF0337 family)